MDYMKPEDVLELIIALREMKNTKRIEVDANGNVRVEFWRPCTCRDDPESDDNG